MPRSVALRLASCRRCATPTTWLRWIDVLREDNRAIVRAASQASKAADWILGFLPANDAEVSTATEQEAA